MKPEGNMLTVVVTNSISDIYPQTADFTFYGGLYRDVNFIEVNEAHFDLLKDGTAGVFVTPHCSGNTRFDLFPVGGEAIAVVIKDAEGNVAARGGAPAVNHTDLLISVKEPHKWHGMEDPYCYTAVAKLLVGEEVVDEVEVTFGYRSFHVDSNTGFWLNGKNVPLHGVSRHQDRLDKGWAISKEDHEEAYENTISQMIELVAQNYNHPSIFFWGISNEILIGADNEPLRKNLRDLNDLAKSMDPSRMTTIAQVSSTPMDSEHNYITDVVSYNHYFGWYGGDVSNNGPWFDAYHALNPDIPLGVSEYGVENIIKWHSATPMNHDYTEEYANYYHHEMLKTFATRPYLWSTHVWNMFNFAADARDEGGVIGRNNKGLVTYDRKTKKDAFYIYKAYWTTEPMVYVAGRRFADRAPEERNITVYTNCDEVTLVVNGVEVATQAALDHAVVFENVALNNGANTITAKAGDVEDTITLNGVAEHNEEYTLPDLAANEECVKCIKGWFMAMGNLTMASMVGAIAGMMGDAKITMLSSMMEGTTQKDFAKLNRLLNKIQK